MGEKAGLEQLCRERGLKVRGRGCAVLKVMDEAQDHPSVDEIYRRALLIDPQISLTTIYRTVNDLAAAQFLTRLEFGDGKTRYEKTGQAHHDHLIDVESGAIVEFSSPQIEAAIREAAATLGYNLFSYRLRVFGQAQKAACRDHAAGKITLLARGR
ncbi:MAG TPA: Fur family transcriptional regulator [Rhizomicrobium sp.]|jgi:Fur family ferric uptake transcriptional regulator|nr:Fur family transcriptional regulator [Rhizomicrobium sp.]